MKIKYLIVLVVTVYCQSIHSQCMLDSIVITSMLIDPTSNEFNFDTNEDGLVNSNDEYIEICNTSNSDVDISNWILGDDDPPPFPDYMIPENTYITAGNCMLIVANYCPDSLSGTTCPTPDGVLSMNLEITGLLGNSGDVVSLFDEEGNSCSVVYGDYNCEDVDDLDIPGFDLENCENWGSDVDGCPLLISGDSCTYLPQALPVEFLSFKGYTNANSEVELIWETIVEGQNSIFVIEWRHEFRDQFYSIGELEGADNDYAIKSYSYTHQNPLSGGNYYRIKQIDINGQYSYTPQIVLPIGYEKSINVTPNITPDKIRIDGETDEYLVQVYNLSGQIVMKNRIVENKSHILLSNLIEGYYILRIFDGQQFESFKILKI